MLMDGSYQRRADPPEPLDVPIETIEDERRPGPAVFDVAPVGRRRRLPDRALILGAMAVLVVGLAVLKPWEGPGDPSVAVVDPSPRAEAPADPSPIDTVPPRPLLGQSRIPAWRDVVEQLEPQDAWGIRALSDPGVGEPATPVRLLDGVRLDAGWVPAVPQGIVRVGGTVPVRMLGVTTPDDEPPLDIRVWRHVRWTDEPVLVDTTRLRGDPGTGESLLASTDSPFDEDGAWSPGTYRFELLLADRITSIDVVIPGPKVSDSTVRWITTVERIEAVNREARFVVPPEPPFDPTAAPIPVGIVGSAVVALPAGLTAPMDAHAAWLGARSGSKPDALAGMDAFAGADLAAIGVALPPGTDVTSLVATRIGGVLDEVVSRRVVDPDGGRVVVLLPEGIGGWLPGPYRVDVGWTEPGGSDRSAAYHLELDPGPATATPRLLAAVRGWARHAGEQGIVVGTVEPLEGGPAAAAIRLLPQEPGSAAETVEALGGRCADGGVLADAIQPVLGVAHRADESIDEVSVERLFVGGRSLPIPVRVSIDPVPGLVLVTPLDPDGWQVGHYRIVLRSAGGELRHVVCLGPGPGARAAVPDDASSSRAFAVESERRRP